MMLIKKETLKIQYGNLKNEVKRSFPPDLLIKNQFFFLFLAHETNNYER